MSSVRLHLKAASAQRLLFSHLDHTLPCLRRTFSTSIRQYAAKRPKSIAKVARPAPMASKPPGGPASSSYKSFNQSLADRSDPVLLYQAASHTIYMAGCYSIGLLIFGWIAHTTSLIHSWPPVKYGSYLKVGYSVMIAMAGGMATLFIIRPFRIIQTIQAVPTTLSRSQKKSLHLQIESARMFPGIKPKTVSIPVNDIQLSRPLFEERSSLNSSGILEARRGEAERLRKLRQGNYFLLPFRQLGFHLSKGVRGLKDAITQNPFIYLRAKGFNGSWKLDKETGWALEDGRAIDRILKSRVTL
ncbi:hypothetical protein XANCAGTX0491_001685 [Xanthoria calcicola]